MNMYENKSMMDLYGQPYEIVIDTEDYDLCIENTFDPYSQLSD